MSEFVPQMPSRTDELQLVSSSRGWKPPLGESEQISDTNRLKRYSIDILMSKDSIDRVNYIYISYFTNLNSPGEQVSVVIDIRVPQHEDPPHEDPSKMVPARAARALTSQVSVFRTWAGHDRFTWHAHTVCECVYTYNCIHTICSYILCM